MPTAREQLGAVTKIVADTGELAGAGVAARNLGAVCTAAVLVPGGMLEVQRRCRSLLTVGPGG